MRIKIKNKPIDDEASKLQDVLAIFQTGEHIDLVPLTFLNIEKESFEQNFNYHV